MVLFLYPKRVFASQSVEERESKNGKRRIYMKLHLDYDEYAHRFTDTYSMLRTIPLPYRVRKSASGEGLHIVKDDGDYTYDDPLYNVYDDPRRLRINRIRQQHGVSHNILWCRKRGDIVEAWSYIRSSGDVLAFMTRLYDIADKNRKQYIPLPPSMVRR